VRADGLVIRPVAPATYGRDVKYINGKKVGDQCTVEVHLKDKSKCFFTGTWQGWAMVGGSRHLPSAGVVSQLPKGSSIKAGPGVGKPFLVFKGAHSTLFFYHENEWFMVDGAIASSGAAPTSKVAGTNKP